MKVTINTPDGASHELTSDQVTVVTEVGQMQILPGHANFLGSIIFSPTIIGLENHEEHFLIRQGFVLVDNQKNLVKLFAFAVDKTESLDHQSIMDYLDFVLCKLEKPEELNHFQINFLTQQHSALKQMIDVIKK